MTVWVAYNTFGDLVAESHSLNGLLNALDCIGYDEDDVVIGRVTP